MVENNSLAELSCYELSSLIFKEYQPRGQAYCWAQGGGGGGGGHSVMQTQFLV